MTGKDSARLLEAEAQWNLGATLLWIGLRDIAEVARPLEYWRTYPVMQSGFTVAMAHLYLVNHANSAAVHSVRPDEDLVGAMRRGAVVASGLKRGQEDRGPVPALDWYDLALTDGPTNLAASQACAFGPGVIHGLQQTPAQFWTRLLFPREQVMEAFPPGLPVATEFPAAPVGEGVPIDASLLTALLAMKEQGKPLRRYTLAAAVVDLQWPSAEAKRRRALVDSLRHWSDAKWAWIEVMADQLGLSRK